jgi:hypothetical protein
VKVRENELNIGVKVNKPVVDELVVTPLSKVWNVKLSGISVESII